MDEDADVWLGEEEVVRCYFMKNIFAMDEYIIRYMYVKLKLNIMYTLYIIILDVMLWHPISCVFMYAVIGVDFSQIQFQSHLSIYLQSFTHCTSISCQSKNG